MKVVTGQLAEKKELMVGQLLMQANCRDFVLMQQPNGEYITVIGVTNVGGPSFALAERLIDLSGIAEINMHHNQIKLTLKKATVERAIKLGKLHLRDC